MATTSLGSSTTQMLARSRRGSAQIRQVSPSATLPQIVQNFTRSLTWVNASASRATSTESDCRTWKAIRCALLGPTPGNLPSSSMRSWTTPSYTRSAYALGPTTSPYAARPRPQSSATAAVGPASPWGHRLPGWLPNRHGRGPNHSRSVTGSVTRLIGIPDVPGPAHRQPRGWRAGRSGAHAGHHVEHGGYRRGADGRRAGADGAAAPATDASGQRDAGDRRPRPDPGPERRRGARYRSRDGLPQRRRVPAAGREPDLDLPRLLRPPSATPRRQSRPPPRRRVLRRSPCDDGRAHMAGRRRPGR